MSATRGESLWRIAKHTTLFKATDLSGGGAKITGGRWNSKGLPAVYTSTTIALATLETMAHLGGQRHVQNAFLVRIDVPENVWAAREYIAAADLDPTWIATPPGSTTVDFGDNWLRTANAPLLMVPSAIVPEEYNVLINPLDPAARSITATVVRQYLYDPRMAPAR